MVEKWYPVIDYSLCTECGACVAECTHGVYKPGLPSPVVNNPEACIEHCHGCGNRCPAGAITYVGDSTGWIPQNSKKEETKNNFHKNGAQGNGETVIEYLYLDLHTCSRCRETETALREVMQTLTPALRLAGFTITVVTKEMATAQLAKEYRFISSPTIRVNGTDICQTVTENDCGCCSELSGTPVACRVFTHKEKIFEVPPKEMLANAILEAVFSRQKPAPSAAYEMPANLQAFYEGKMKKGGCSCGSGCC